MLTHTNIVAQGVSVRVFFHPLTIHDAPCLRMRLWSLRVHLSLVSFLLPPHLQCCHRRGLKTNALSSCGHSDRPTTRARCRTKSRSSSRAPLGSKQRREKGTGECHVHERSALAQRKPERPAIRQEGRPKTRLGQMMHLCCPTERPTIAIC